MPQIPKALPLGTSVFERLVFQNQIYVDKTELIYSLLEIGQKFFLTRPRRFGKTLLLSIFDSLFRNGTTYFKGLAIEKLWKEEPAGTVLNLDFSLIKGFKSVAEFTELFDDYLCDLLFDSKLVAKRPDSGTGQRTFSSWLSSQPIASVVILIDEYDTPLTESLDRPALFQDVRAILSRFYARLKNADRALRFLFITGVTKFTKASIFSELNNLRDISLSPKYGTLLGYTREELLTYFRPWLEKAALQYGVGLDRLLEDLRQHYDGYCFDKAASTHVYSPWSVLNFLSLPEDGFENYWLESGGKPSVLMKYFRTHALRSPASLMDEKCVRMEDLSSASDLENLNDLALLCQAGYLTIKRVDYTSVFLGYPNLEVKRSMGSLYANALLGNNTFSTAGADHIDRQLATEKPEGIVHLFNRLFASTDYQFFHEIHERDVQAILFAYLAGSGLEPVVERHGSRGRSDIEVVSGDRAWVFEIKVQRKTESAEKKLEEALSQIASRGYGEDRNPDRFEIIRIGLVFSEESRRIVKWGLAPQGRSFEEA